MTAAVKTDQYMQMLIRLHEVIQKEDDKRKIVELNEKLYHDKLYIAFAGHFSAGKSSMINKLLNEQVLPTSPIPTSANLVLLENGQNEVTLYSKQKEVIKLASDYSIEQIKDFCKQGDEIERISIRKPYNHLSENIVIMDTPGIDSTDVAHKLSTESMLHIADIIFYVTDYNHVQSEENIAFITEMKEREKLVFLIVNQIDKHNENEVKFSTFKQQIIDTFIETGLHEDDVFFTTLKNDEHKENQLSEIQQIIQAMVQDKEKYLEKNVQKSTEYIVHEHLSKYKEQLQLNNNGKNDLLATLEKYVKKSEMLKEKLSQEEAFILEISQEMNDKLSSILQSANIIPYETREKAKLFLEALEPNFKVGILFSKAKTEQEREKRVKDLFEALVKNVETQITWHLTPLFKEYIQKYTIIHDETLQRVEAFSIKLTKEMIKDTVKTGASFNNQYILTFSSDISELIKRESKREAHAIFEMILSEINTKKQLDMSQLKEELGEVVNEITQIENKLNKWEKFTQYEQLLATAVSQPVNTKIHIEEWLKENNLYKQVKQEKFIENIKIEHKVIGSDKQEEVNYQSNLNHKDNFITETELLLSRLQTINGFKQISESLKEKVANYRNRKYTVALFGAFSAGKSSFANALIGERLLPSSPTPTTATINKIAPPSNGKEHGKVEVKLKSIEQLIEEVVESIPQLKKMNSIEEIISQLKEMESSNNAEKEAIRKYVMALADYEMLAKSGLIQSLTLDNFKDYVAKEEKACLVEEVIVYYDCPVTKAGITLVDTPGADSLHKRHTDVAFQYMKNADVILYVTYYNHPFSKGDREFLRQLGRVKDTFTLDKMFFIINAIDLAKDEEEVRLVKDYIYDQLLQQELRNVRLYGVSSINVLNKKHGRDYNKFRDEFDFFIKQELTNKTILSIHEDLKRANERLRSLIEIAEKDEAEKEKTLAKQKEEKVKVQQALASYNGTHIEKSVNKEIEELLFYVKQRIFLRFTDYFKEAFHPGAFTNKGDTQSILHLSLQELTKTIEFELLQELQATSLRIEKFIMNTLKQEEKRISNLIKGLTKSITLTSQQEVKINTPTLKVEYAHSWEISLKPSLKLFKNSKTFFEKNEKQKMNDDLQNRLQDPFQLALNDYQEQFIVYYNNVVQKQLKQLLKSIDNQVDEGYNALFEIDSIDIEQLKLQEYQIKNVITILSS